MNLFAGEGVSVREVIMAMGHSRADYLLYVDQEPLAWFEAKPADTTLSEVEWRPRCKRRGCRATLDSRLTALELQLTDGERAGLEAVACMAVRRPAMPGPFGSVPGDVLMNEGGDRDKLARVGCGRAS